MENKISVRIETNIPITIFEKPVLKVLVSNLFDSNEEKIKSRVNEILTFIGSDYIEKLSSDEIVFFFKGYFYKLILNEAVKMTFSEEANFDALKNIKSLLTNEKLENAIMGEPMIEAFSKAIRNLPNDGFLTPVLHGSKIMLLKSKFLGQRIFPTFEEKEKKRQKNYCSDWGCSCTCDGGCNGDTNKCTSEKAKGCNHHCDCYIGPMVKKFPK